MGLAARRRGGDPDAASVAAGVDRCPGAALRLLPKRNADPGRGSPLDDEGAVRRRDPNSVERPSVSLRDLSADPDRDPASGERDGEGRCVMANSTYTEELSGVAARAWVLDEKEFSRRSFLRGGGSLVIGLSLVGAVAAGARAAN